MHAQAIASAGLPRSLAHSGNFNGTFSHTSNRDPFGTTSLFVKQIVLRTMLALLLALLFSNAGAAWTFNAVVLYSSSDVTWLEAALLEADLPAAALTSGFVAKTQKGTKTTTFSWLEATFFGVLLGRI